MQSSLEGFGIGLRKEFWHTLIDTDLHLDWIEITPEHWTERPSRHRLIDRYRERWPIAPHSVSLSIGDCQPLDRNGVELITQLCRRIDAPFWSDHISFARVNGLQTHDLLPLPFNDEAIEHVVQRIQNLQARIDVPLAFENPSFYAFMPDSKLDEATFLRQVWLEAGCGILFDVNNVFVNSTNHGTDPKAVIDSVPFDQVWQIHLAGHSYIQNTIIDTHKGPIPDGVWELYRYTIQRAGRIIPTLIEWDTEVPSYEMVIAEADKAREHAYEALAMMAGEGVA